jgi:hypothetical protein
MKDVLWDKVKEKFVYPEGTENAGRTFAEGLCVTTPPEIIPYYRLNHSIWSLSDNKEVSH